MTKDLDFKAEFEVFFSVSLDMLCISSYDGFFKKMNPAVQTILGFTPDEICAKSYLDFIHPDDIEVTKQEVERQLLTKQQVFNFENRYRCKDGSYKLLSWKSAPVGDLMYAVARDITESRQAEEALKKAKEAAEKANRELESFSYSVAHDLRAPLRAMMGFSHVLLENHSQFMDKTGQDCLWRVASAAKTMGQLVDGLLDLSQLTRKKVVLQSVNMTDLAQQIFVEIQESEPSRKVFFKNSPNIMVDGDPQLLRAVIANLLSNAWKYTSKRADSAEIEFGVMDHEGRPAYFIRDNGAGFDMKYVDKLFGPFQRLHTAQEFAGIGIGLATVQRIVQNHGGKVWAEGEPQKGATFFFTLESTEYEN